MVWARKTRGGVSVDVAVLSLAEPCVRFSYIDPDDVPFAVVYERDALEGMNVSRNRIVIPDPNPRLRFVVRVLDGVVDDAKVLQEVTLHGGR